MVEPFTIAVSDERLATIRAKVEAFDWEMVPDAGERRSGVGLTDLRRVVGYWLTRYDWRAQERRLTPYRSSPPMCSASDCISSTRRDGSRSPLLLLHGWPGSFLELEALIAPLLADGPRPVVGGQGRGRPIGTAPL